MRRELRTLQVRETTGRQFSQSGCGSKCLKRCNLLQASPGLISQQEHISTSSVSVCGPDSAIHHPSAQISISSRGTRAARLLTLTKRFSSCEGNTDARGTWIDEESNALICGFARRVSVGESEAMAHEQERVCQPWTRITSFTARVTYDAYWEPKEYCLKPDDFLWFSVLQNCNKVLHDASANRSNRPPPHYHIGNISRK